MSSSNTHSPRIKDKKIFSFFVDVKTTIKTKDLYLSEYLFMLTDPARKKEVEKLRRLPATEYKRRKVHQPCITGSVIIDSKGRKMVNILCYNGFAVVDIDRLPTSYKSWQEVKEVLGSDQYSYLTHFSLSGRGLCVFVKVELLNDFKEIYLSLERYYFEQYGIKIDLLADETRLRFISYDPDYILNENSKIYEDYLEETISEKTLEYKDDFNDFEDYGDISNDPATTFNNNRDIGAKLICSDLEERGWNVRAGKGKEAFIATRPGGQDRSVVILNNEDVYKVSVLSSNVGISPGVYNMYDFYKTLHRFNDYEAEKQLSEKGFGVFHEAKPIKLNGKESYSFILEYLTKQNIRLNQLTGIIEKGGVPLNDFHNSEMLTELSLYSGKNQSKEILLSCLDVLANGNQYHPFKDFVKELEVIEETDFLGLDEMDRFIDCFTSSTPKKTIRIYFIRWMLGLFDLHFNQRMTKNVLVVSGAQNSCKTSLSKNILPKSLRQYGKVIDFSPNKITDTKIALCSVLVACFDEFEEILYKHKTLGEFKNLTSSYDIFERRPYRRNHEQMFRSSIVMATTNERNILTDSTGNTRFLTIDVKAFDLERYFKIDLMRLWRVIYDLHLASETSVLNEAERGLQEIENKSFEAVDQYCEMLEKVFIYEINGFMTSTEIMQLLEFETRQSLNINRIGQALRKLGFERKSKRVQGSPKYGYSLAVR